MKIYVCIKQVPDTESKIKLNSDSSGIDTAGIKWVISPYDEYAIEEALQMKSRHEGSTVTVVSLGPKPRIIDSIRTALAMGADDGIAIDAPENLDSFSTAQAIAKTIQNEGSCDIIFTGKQAIDTNFASVSQQLADFLSLPHATVVSKLEEDGASFVAEREIEGGSKERIQLNGACVIGANKGLNTPRYASLPGIMKAKKKPVKDVEFASLGLGDDTQKIKFVDYQLPPDKPAVQILGGEALEQAKSLVTKLREEAKVI